MAQAIRLEQIPSDNVEGLQPTIEIQSNEWNNIPVSYFGETIDLTHLKRGLEGSLCHHRGGLVTCIITQLAPAVVPLKYEQIS